MGWFSSATKWVKKNVVQPVSNFVTETVPSFFDKVGDVLEAGGNFISGLASVKFGTSGTVSGGSGNDLVVGLDFGSIADFLRLSFTTLFSKEFWSTGQLPSSVSGFANDNSNRITLDGNGGNDTMFVFGGFPTVYGDEGNDKILALGGENRLYGGSGNDFIVGAGVINTVWAGTGNDVAIVLGGKNTVRGEAGDDDLTVFGALNDIDGGADRDLIIALGGSNTARGGSGDDRLFLGLGGNFGYGDAGNDLVVGAAVSNALYGGSGADVIIAIGGANFVYGDANFGNIFGSGNGTNEAGAGNDVIVSFGVGNFIWAEGGNDVVTSFGGGVFADGGAGNDVIVALAGGNVIAGGGGDDVVVALGTVNAISGGGGDDVVVSFGTLDLSRGGDGDDIMVGVGAPVVAFQLGDAGQDIIVGVGGTVRVQFGDDPFSFVPGGDGDDDAKRDGILGFVEQVLLDFQFTDFEFEDLSLPTLPTLDDLDSGALEAGEAFVRGVWDGMKGVYGTLSLVTELFDPDTYNTDRLFTAFAELEFPGFTKPSFSGLSFGTFNPFNLDSLGFGSLDGFSAPATPDFSGLDDVALGYEGFDDPLDPAFSALSIVVPDSGTSGIGLPDTNALLPNLSTGFSQSSLGGVASYFPGESLSTSGLPSLAFADLLDLDDFALPDADGLLASVTDLELPSFAALDALGATFSGLSGLFEGAGLFQPGSGRGSFSLPALSLPQISLPSFDLYAPEAGDDSDILISIAGGSLLFGQEDDDLLIGASLANFQFGGSGADIMVALAKGNLLSGGQDDDVIVGLGLVNLISGGEGSDIIGAGGKFNLVAGGTDEDLIIGAGLANILLGGSGRDVMGGGGKLNILAGGADNDLMLGGGKFNVALAGAGDDLVIGGGTLNVMLGGEGNDLTIGFGKFNSLLAGEGNDIVIGGGTFNVIDGDVGDDLIVGGGKFNLLYARGGNDALVGGGTFNSMFGGQGTDLVLGGGKFNLFMSGTEVDDDEEDHDIVFVAGRYNTFFAGAGDDLAFVGGGELNTTFMGSGQDIVISFSSNLNFILGQEDADIILGAGVGNIYAGGTGNDLLFGFGRDEGNGGQGGGNDTSGGGGGSGTQLDILTDGSVTLNGDFGNDLLIATGTNVQASGGTGNDKILAAGALNFIDGDEGYDFLFSALGLSALDGGDGNDVIFSKGTLPDFGKKSLAELVFDGGDVQGGKGSDLIWVNGSDIEVFGDTGVSVFSPTEAPDGDTRDAQDGDDIIVISGARSEAYGQAGDDLMVLFGTTHRADGGEGADLMIAFGDNSEIDGAEGNDEIINIGSGLARAFGGADDDVVMGKGYTLLGWLSERGDAVWTEFSDAVFTLLGNIGELISNTIASVGTFRGFDGSQITGDYLFAGRDGLGAPEVEVIPSEQEIRDAEVDAMTTFVFALIDEYGIDGLGSALEQLNDPSFATFAPSYDTLAGDLVQAAVTIASPLASAPSLFGSATDLSVSVLVAASPTAPIFAGGSGDDVVSGRVGLSTLLAGAGDDSYVKAVGERITIVDEEGLGGDDTLTISAYATDLAGFGLNGGALVGLTSAAVTYELADLDAEGVADDLIIRVSNTAGVIRSLTVVMDQLQAGSAVETLVLESGVNGGVEVIDLVAAAASASVNTAPTVDASELSVLVNNDIALLESELMSSAVYNDLFLYDAFALDEGATSDTGQGFADLEAQLDTYFGTLQTVEPGASTVGNGSLEQTLDGEAFSGAPSVSIPPDGAQVVIEDGVTRQVQRFDRDGLPRFDILMSSDGGSTGFSDVHALPGDPVFIEAIARDDATLRFTGIDRELAMLELPTALTEAGFTGNPGNIGGDYAFVELGVIRSDTTDTGTPVDLRSTAYFDAAFGTIGGALYLDGDGLGGLAVRAEGFRNVALDGDATLISLGNTWIAGGTGAQTVEVRGDTIRANLGAGDDIYRLFDGTGTFVGGLDDDLFEISIDTADPGRAFTLEGNGGFDVYRFLPLGEGGVAGGTVAIGADAFDLIDLSLIGPDATVVGIEDGFRILQGGGETRVTFTGVLPSLLWTDGIERQIVPAYSFDYNLTDPQVMFIGPASVGVSGGGTGFLSGQGDDLIFVDQPGSTIQPFGGDDVVFVAANPSASGTDLLGYYGNDRFHSDDPDTTVTFDHALSEYRILQGFDVLSVVHDASGQVTTISGDFAYLRFSQGSVTVLPAAFPDTPVTDIVATEDTPLDLGLAAPAGLPASGVSVRVMIDDTGGTFERISTGEAIADMDVLDPADLPDIRFVPLPDFFGPAGSALLQLEFFDARGVLDRVDYRIAVTGTDDPVSFGFDGLTTGEALDLVEGLPDAPLRLLFSDADLEYDGAFQLYLAPGANLDGLVIDSPHSFAQGDFIGSVAELQAILAATQISWGENDNGTATFVLDGTGANGLGVLAQELRVEAVDDPETFTGVPTDVFQLPENTTTTLFPALNVTSVDGDSGQYRVEVVSALTTIAAGGGFAYSPWPISPGGLGSDHPGGARSSEQYIVEPGLTEGFSVIGTIDQLNDALDEILISGTLNYEGLYDFEVRLYKVTGDVADRDPRTLIIPEGEELQDSFIRTVDFTPGVNAPLAERGRSYYMPADIGTVELDLPEPYDPDFLLDSQPDFTVRIGRVPEYGELRLADGTALSDFTNISVADWVGLTYTPDPGLLPNPPGARNADGFSFLVITPLGGTTVTQNGVRIYVYQDEEEVPDGAGGTVTQPVALNYYGSLNFDSPFSNSVFYGGDGDDTINPFNGIDMMLGGAGADTFVIDDETGEFNVIGDFEIGVDILDFGGLAVAQLVEDYRFADDELADTTLDTILILTNGAELVLEDVTGLLPLINVAPLGGLDTFDVAENPGYAEVPVSFSGNVLDNDVDQNGDPFFVDLDSVIGPQRGTLDIAADGSFTYTPDANFFGVDQFGYVPTDGTDAGPLVVVTLNVIDDPLNGTDADDVIDGPDASATLSGNDGDDVLTGGRFTDFFYGGMGADVIVTGGGGDVLYATLAELDGDVIEDFSPLDRLVLTDAVMPSLDVAREGDYFRITLGQAGRDYTFSIGAGLDGLPNLSGNIGYRILSSGQTEFRVGEYYGRILSDGSERAVFTGSGTEILGRDGDDVMHSSGFGTFLGGSGDDLLSVTSTYGYLNGGHGSNVLRILEGTGYFSFHAGDFDLAAPDRPQMQTITGLDRPNTSSVFILNGFGFTSVADLVLTERAGGTLIDLGENRFVFVEDVLPNAFDGSFRFDQYSYGNGIEIVNLDGKIILGEGQEPVTWANGGATDDEVVGADAADSIAGGDGDDTLRGFGGDDTLSGGAGNDSLFGGEGVNILTGGAGRDTFVLEGVGTPAATRDIITDFELGIDQFVFNGLPGITSLADIGRSADENGLELDLGGGRTILLPDFTLSETFSDNDIVINPGGAGGGIGMPGATDLPTDDPDADAYLIRGYSVSLGAFNTARVLGDLGATIELDELKTFRLLDTDGLAETGSGAYSVVDVGGDDQGEITGLYHVRLDPVDPSLPSLDFAMIERDLVADHLLVPLNGSLDRMISAGPEALGSYVLAGVTALPAALGIANLVDGTDFDELLVGTDVSDEIIGGGGNDELTGGAGNDLLIGGSGGADWFDFRFDDPGEQPFLF